MTRKASTSLKRKPPKRKPMPRKAAKHDPLDAAIDANAKMLALKIDKAWRPAIRAHLQVILRHGALVQAFKLADDAEPAPVFEPRASPKI